MKILQTRKEIIMNRKFVVNVGRDFTGGVFDFMGSR